MIRHRCIQLPMAMLALLISFTPILPQDHGKTEEKPQVKMISAAMLRNVIGQDHRSDDLMRIRSILGLLPLAAYDQGAVYSNLWFAKGLVITFGEKNEVVSISRFSGENIGAGSAFGTYPYELPEKLMFDDSREDIKKKLGKPTRTVGSPGDLPTVYIYDLKGISVGFSPESKVTSVRIFAPKKNEE